MMIERRKLMTERQEALAKKDYTRFQELTVKIAQLDMPGVKLTEADKIRYAKKGR